MKYKLRPYQKEAVDIGVSFFKQKDNEHGIMVLPGGAGKSIIIGKIATSLKGNVLILQPSKELTEQNYEKVTSCGMMIDVAIYSASLNRKDIAKITLATIGSIYRKPELFKIFEAIIVDECDAIDPRQGMYKTFLDSISNHKTLGLTATPFRAYRNSFGTEFRFITRTRPKVFKKVLYCVQNDYLFNGGYLSPLKYYQMDTVDVSKLKVNSTGLDYVDSSVIEYYENTDFYNGLAEITRRVLKKRPNVMVFTKFVKEAEHVAKILGDEAAVVSANTKKKEREDIIKRARSGQLKVLLNAKCLGIGVDIPNLSSILIARPMRSLREYIQFVSRGTRLHNEKEDCWIIDIVGTYRMFGKIEDIRTRNTGNGKWILENKERQLTNVYLENDRPCMY